MRYLSAKLLFFNTSSVICAAERVTNATNPLGEGFYMVAVGRGFTTKPVGVDILGDPHKQIKKSSLAGKCAAP